MSKLGSLCHDKVISNLNLDYEKIDILTFDKVTVESTDWVSALTTCRWWMQLKKSGTKLVKKVLKIESLRKFDGDSKLLTTLI